jgi:hypothetical protein
MKRKAFACFCSQIQGVYAQAKTEVEKYLGGRLKTETEEALPEPSDDYIVVSDDTS